VVKGKIASTGRERGRKTPRGERSLAAKGVAPKGPRFDGGGKKKGHTAHGGRERGGKKGSL